MSLVVDGAADAELRSLLVRAADSLGWTHGQVWTVVIGLLLAAPAAVFGLGPAIADRAEFAAAPAPIAPVGTPAVDETGQPAPALESTDGVSSPAGDPAPVLPSVPADPTDPGVGPPEGVDRVESPPVAPAPPTGDGRSTIGGSGEVTAIAADDVITAVVVDDGPDQAGRLVLLGADGSLDAEVALVRGATEYGGAGGVALTDDAVFVVTSSPAAVLRVERDTRKVAQVATLPDLSPCLPLVATADCQVSLPDTPPAARHVAAATNGDLYVADHGQGCILRVAAGDARARPWLCDAVFASSTAAPEGGVAGVAVAGDRLVVSVAEAGLDRTDRVEAIEIRGRVAGPRRTLATGDGSARPRGLVVTPAGTVLVALVDAGAVLEVSADGSESRTVQLPGVVTPVDLALRRGDLLVLDRASDQAGIVSVHDADSI